MEQIVEARRDPESLRELGAVANWIAHWL